MKKHLVIGIGLLLVVAGIAASNALLSSLRPTAAAKAQGIREIDLSEIKPGELKILGVAEGPLFLYRPTQKTWDDLQALGKIRELPAIDTYREDLGVFVYLGVSTVHGCALIEVKGTEEAVANSELGGRGGYYDPCHGARYDYAGRNVSTHWPSLKSVPLLKVGPTLARYEPRPSKPIP